MESDVHSSHRGENRQGMEETQVSDLQPKGIPIEIGGVERHLLFTIAAVDEIQAKYDAPLSAVMEMLQEDDKVIGVTFNLMLILINDEINRNRFFNKEKVENLTEQELKWLMDVSKLDMYIAAILRAYGVSLPEMEDNDPNAESRSD